MSATPSESNTHSPSMLPVTSRTSGNALNAHTYPNDPTEQIFSGTAPQVHRRRVRPKCRPCEVRRQAARARNTRLREKRPKSGTPRVENDTCTLIAAREHFSCAEASVLLVVVEHQHLGIGVPKLPLHWPQRKREASKGKNNVPRSTPRNNMLTLWGVSKK